MGAEYHRLCRACGYEPGELPDGEIHRLASDRIDSLQASIRQATGIRRDNWRDGFAVGVGTATVIGIVATLIFHGMKG